MSASKTDARTVRIAAAKRSPELANQHDEAGWLGLYGPQAVVEDPVGTPPCQRGVFTRKGSKDDLERFYATFIAPSKIRVEEIGDFVCGNTVVRDVVLHVKLPGGGGASVPAILEYHFVETPMGLKVEHLRAYWDAGKNGREMLASGLAGKLTSLLSGLRLVRVLGRDWTDRYIAGTKKGIRREGPTKVAALERALASGDAGEFDAVCISTASLVAPGAPAAPIRMRNDAISSIRFTNATSCGYFATARFTASRAGLEIHGIAFVEFDPESKLVSQLRLFWEKL